MVCAPVKFMYCMLMVTCTIKFLIHTLCLLLLLLPTSIGVLFRIVACIGRIFFSNSLKDSTFMYSFANEKSVSGSWRVNWYFDFLHTTLGTHACALLPLFILFSSLLQTRPSWWFTENQKIVSLSNSLSAASHLRPIPATAARISHGSSSARISSPDNWPPVVGWGDEDRGARWEGSWVEQEVQSRAERNGDAMGWNLWLLRKKTVSK